MAQLNYPHVLDPNANRNVNDLNANLAAVQSVVNGGLDNDNLNGSAGIAAGNLADAAILGLTAGSTARRGKSIIATTESRTNAAYGLMTTPDRVSSVVLPADGLLVIGYKANWQESVKGAARAAIFLGANQLKAPQTGGSIGVQEASHNSTPAAVDAPLVTTPVGLDGDGNGGSAMSADVTTGQVLAHWDNNGGFCVVFAAAGTYDVSVQFKASSGSVTVKNRKLWVWTIGF